MTFVFCIYPIYKKHQFITLLDNPVRARFRRLALFIVTRCGVENPFGKEVLVVIELRARFDEEANINLAAKLQSVGAQVVYGVVGLKTHAKMCLVIRREGRSLNRYVHLGTGNYHMRTTRLYTDYGLFSCERDVAEDVQKIFQQLTAMGKAGKLKKILQALWSLLEDLTVGNRCRAIIKQVWYIFCSPRFDDSQFAVPLEFFRRHHKTKLDI